MISIILPNLQGGGAERVVINLANAWISSGIRVEIVLMERRGEFLTNVNTSVSIASLGCTRIRQVPWRLVQYLRDRKPDVTFVNMWPLTSAAVLAWRLAGRPGKLFVCEHVYLSEHVRRDLRIPHSLAKAVLRFTHHRASGVVAVSSGMARDLAQLAGLSEERVTVIHNPVVSAALPSLLRQHDTEARCRLWRGRFRTYLLTVGTLKLQKNHGLLLKAFRKVAIDLDAALVILGDGVLRSTLEKDVEELGLGDRVVMPGFFSDPTPWYQAADLFVLTSDFEGFANVLAEALACGTPVLSTDCPYGPSEILENGRYGELVPVGDAEALAAGIRRALDRSWDRPALQRRALEFSIPVRAQAYLDLFSRQ